MALITDQKWPQFSQDERTYPDLVAESPWERLEPLVTPDQIRDRHLWGLPLVSYFPDPRTGKVSAITNEQIKDWIDMKISLIEERAHITIAPSLVDMPYPFDRNEYKSHGYCSLPKRPLSSLISLQVCTADNSIFFDVPLKWIVTSYLVRGQISIQPYGVVSYPTAAIPAAPPFLSFLTTLGWSPQLWRVKATAGFPNMLLPKFLNWLIGIMTAIEILSQLQATYAFGQSGSLSIDGLSQSSSGPGPQAYAGRIQELDQEKEKLLRHLRSFAGMAIFSSTV